MFAIASEKEIETETVVPATKSTTQALDQNYPLYLHSADVSGIFLIFLLLNDSENYSIWSKSMRIALLGRNKLGFVDGSWKKKSFSTELGYQWERCNAVVQSWLMNTVSSSLLGGMVYATITYEV